MLLELLSGVVDATFDLIEFVKAGIEGEQDMKSADGGIAFVGRKHFALEGKQGIGSGSGHERFLERGLKIKEG
jgi:hypothetical protein